MTTPESLVPNTYPGGGTQGRQPAAQPYAPAGQPVQPAPQGYSAVPQGIAPGYAPVPQGPVVQKVNKASIILGVIGCSLVGLMILGMWLALRATASEPDSSGKGVIGFIPLFALIPIVSVSLGGGIAGILGAVGKPKTRKLNWLGILLNVCPVAIFVIFLMLL